MTRLLLLVLALVVVLAPSGTSATFKSATFESPIFSSPLPAGDDGRIYAQSGSVYLLPTVRVGDPTR